MVEDEWLPFMWHQGRLADWGEMVSQLCRMAAIEKAFGETESWPLMLKASHPIERLAPYE
jgi:hypothetical protein